MVLPLESAMIDVGNLAVADHQMTAVEIMDHLITLACKMYNSDDAHMKMLLALPSHEKAMACELIMKRIDVIEQGRRAEGWITRWCPCHR